MEEALGVGDVKFKGQIRPYHKKIIYSIDIKRVINKENKYMIWADGTVTTDQDKTIYFAKNLQVGLFDNLTYDFGGDPSLDAFKLGFIEVSTMALQCGIVGLPNVGKSSLFNALTQSSIPAEKLSLFVRLTLIKEL